MSHLKQADKERERFCSIQAVLGLDETHLHSRRQSAFFRLLIERLISSRNILTDTLEIMFDQISRYPVSQSS